MAYYCGECAVWVGSDDVDKNGRRWCAHSRKYEKSNQSADGCKGFVYNGRTVLTKVCEILSLSTDEWFPYFDRIKNEYVAPEHMPWLSEYCVLGPAIANKMEHDPDKNNIAQGIYDSTLLPAKQLFNAGKLRESAILYRNLIVDLCRHYCIDYI